jgi:glycosyltransferase involved in cell wall biosynthesis
VSDKELRHLYNGAAVFVFGARHEPFGLVVLEAMASGIPVVAVAEGGVPEIVEDGLTGRLVPRDEGAFANALDGLLRDQGLRHAMGRAARAAVEKWWDWDVATCRLEGHLSTLARHTGSGELEQI